MEGLLEVEGVNLHAQVEGQFATPGLALAIEVLQTTGQVHGHLLVAERQSHSRTIALLEITAVDGQVTTGVDQPYHRPETVVAGQMRQRQSAETLILVTLRQIATSASEDPVAAIELQVTSDDRHRTTVTDKGRLNAEAQMSIALEAVDLLLDEQSVVFSVDDHQLDLVLADRIHGVGSVGRGRRDELLIEAELGLIGGLASRDRKLDPRREGHRESQRRNIVVNGQGLGRSAIARGADDSRTILAVFDAVDLEVTGLVADEAQVDLSLELETGQSQDLIRRRVTPALRQAVVVELHLVEIDRTKLGILLQNLEQSPLGVIVGHDHVEVGLTLVGQIDPALEAVVEVDVFGIDGDTGLTRFEVDDHRIALSLDVVVRRLSLNHRGQTQAYEQRKDEVFQLLPPSGCALVARFPPNTLGR